jgi:hypothetical protein
VDPVASDYDGDGWTDLVARNSEKNELIFLRNLQGETFEFDQAIDLPPPNPNYPTYKGLLVGNINGDNYDDFAAFGQHGLAILINDDQAPGTFTLDMITNCRKGVAGHLVDLNHDTYGDLVVGGVDAMRIYLFNPDTGAYPEQSSYQLDTTFTIEGVVTVDLNNDDEQDIVTLTHDRLIWYLADGAGGYVQSPPISLEPIASNTLLKSIIAADMNGDSLDDVVFTAANVDLEIAPYPNGAVAVALSDGNGGFQGSIVYTEVPGTGSGLTGATDVMSKDLDLDGFLDLLVTAAGRNAVIFFQGDGAGGITCARHYAVGDDPLNLVSLDADEDGNLDLAVAEPEAATLSFLPGNAAGGAFQEVEGFLCGVDIPIPFGPDKMDAADFDDDGFIDFVIMDALALQMALLKNDGAGGFTLFHHFTVVNGKDWTLNDFCVVQANPKTDRHPDLAVVSNGPDPTPGLLSVFVNDGNGFFSKELVTQVSESPVKVRAGDFDNDGFQDLTLVQADRNSLLLFESQGDGQFKPLPERGPLPLPFGLTLGDLDNDFDLDGTVTSPEGEALYLLPTDTQVGPLNTGPGFSVLDALGEPTDIDVADLNQDGFPDLAANDLFDPLCRLFFNDGFMSFPETLALALSGPADSLAAHNLNFDLDEVFDQPRMDLCLASKAASGLDLLLYVPDGKGLELTDDSPLPINGFDTMARPLWVDLNGDLLPELVMPSRKEKKITFLINRSQ